MMTSICIEPNPSPAVCGLVVWRKATRKHKFPIPLDVCSCVYVCLVHGDIERESDIMYNTSS